MTRPSCLLPKLKPGKDLTERGSAIVAALTFEERQGASCCWNAWGPRLLVGLLTSARGKAPTMGPQSGLPRALACLPSRHGRQW